MPIIESSMDYCTGVITIIWDGNVKYQDFKDYVLEQYGIEECTLIIESSPSEFKGLSNFGVAKVDTGGPSFDTETYTKVYIVSPHSIQVVYAEKFPLSGRIYVDGTIGRNDEFLLWNDDCSSYREWWCESEAEALDMYRRCREQKVKELLLEVERLQGAEPPEVIDYTMDERKVEQTD